MTQRNIRYYSTFKTLYNQGYAARQKLHDRVQEAIQNNETDLASCLNAERSAIGKRLTQIRKSQVAYLTSEAPAGITPVARLKRIIVQAQDDLEDLEDLAEALDAATRILKTFTRLISLGH